jgi:hypothetical protein
MYLLTPIFYCCISLILHSYMLSLERPIMMPFVPADFSEYPALLVICYSCLLQPLYTLCNRLRLMLAFQFGDRIDSYIK